MSHCGGMGTGIGSRFFMDRPKSPSQLMPYVDQIVSLLKRWLLGRITAQ